MRKSQLKEILQREPVYINPYTDFGFKLLFGEEANKDLLIDFLNQMLPPHHQIKDLTFTNNEKIPELEGKEKLSLIFHVFL
jgi:predicted transposase/invertase (TIGR01784 family)